MIDGLLLVDKPQDLTSADVVRAVKRRWRSKTGHLGTLDPFATGLLPICLGEGTKVAPFLNTADKSYTGVIRLGVRTDTGDPTGTVVETAAVPPLGAARLEDVAARFVGDRLQVPPMHSAIKRDGTPLYRLARRGIEVERAARPVRIAALTLVLEAPDRVRFALDCSKGTYVRVLAADVALALGTVGHLGELRRTRFGPFAIAEAVPMDAVQNGAPHILTVREALRGVRELQVDAATAGRVRRGYEPVLRTLGDGRLAEVLKVVDPAGAVVAVVVMAEPGRWRFGRIFAPPDRVGNA